MRVVVAGAGGATGRALLPLLSKDHDVVGLDRPDVAPTEGFQWLVADIRDWRGLQHAFAAVHPIDAVVVLVSAPNAGFGTKDQVRAHFDTDVAGTWTLLNQALEAGIRRFVYVSSLRVYGDLSTGTHEESDNLIANHTRDDLEPYGLSKLFGEQVVAHLCSTRGASGVVLRLDGVHVPGVMERRGIHIEDIAAAVHLALTADVSGLAICNITARPEHHRAPIDRAKTLLGWTPQHPLELQPDLEDWSMRTAAPLSSVPLPEL